MQKKIESPLKDHIKIVFNEIQILKTLVVKGQKYEGADALKDFEKSLVFFAYKMRVNLLDPFYQDK